MGGDGSGEVGSGPGCGTPGSAGSTGDGGAGIGWGIPGSDGSAGGMTDMHASYP